MVCLTSALVALGDPACAQSFDLSDAIALAAEGDVIHVPAGHYGGPIIIDTPLTLIAEGTVILDGGGKGDVIRINAPDVVIRGFTIQNTGISLDREDAGITVLAPRVTIENNVLRDVLFGIYLKKAPDSILRGNRIGGKELDIARRGDGIRLWYSPRTLIERNVVENSRDVVLWFCDGLLLRHNEILNGRYGLHFMYSNENVIEDNWLEGNSVGGFLMYSNNLTLRRNVFARSRGPSGYGIGLKDMDGVVAEDNAFIGNRIGVYLDNSPSTVNGHGFFRRNVFASNDIGVAFMPSVQRNTLVENTFLDNIEQVAVLGGGKFAGNTFTVDGRGNFWSDYRGYDLDGDRIGDFPYRSEGLFENLMDREPKLRLFIYSPAQQAIDLAARAFPVVKPRPKFTDTAPLMQPVPFRGRIAVTPAPWEMARLSGGLIALAALVLLAGRWRGGTLGSIGRPAAITHGGGA